MTTLVAPVKFPISTGTAKSSVAIEIGLLVAFPVIETPPVPAAITTAPEDQPIVVAAVPVALIDAVPT